MQTGRCSSKVPGSPGVQRQQGLRHTVRAKFENVVEMVTPWIQYEGEMMWLRRRQQQQQLRQLHGGGQRLQQDRPTVLSCGSGRKPKPCRTCEPSRTPSKLQFLGSALLILSALCSHNLLLSLFTCTAECLHHTMLALLPTCLPSCSPSD